MTTYLVRKTGSDAANGLTPGTAKLTIQAALNVATTAGDTVYAGAGSYHETLTMPASGSVGNPISVIGDCDGSQTGDAGRVRITGAATNNQSVSRASAIIGSSKNYCTFKNLMIDSCSGEPVHLTSCQNFTFTNCIFANYTAAGSASIYCIGVSQAALTVQRCTFIGVDALSVISQVYFFHSSVVDNAAHVVDRCLFVGGSGSCAVRSDRVGGVTVRNCTFAGYYSIVCRVAVALTAGQLMTVNNCLITGANTALRATTTAEFSENYNNIFGCGTSRNNVTAGANSVAYPIFFDPRAFLEAFAAGTMISPWELDAASALVELNSGTGASSTDWRGTAVKGSFLEWGAAEYDSALSVAGGGGIVVSPLGQQFINALMGGG